MRSGLLLFLAFSSACADGVVEPATVRDRLESAETQLIIATAESTGSITALRRSAGAWVAGTVNITMKRGELVTRADARGAISIDRLAVDLEPIAIPKSVFGYEAQLTEVHLQAERPVGVVTQWTGDDRARATAQVELALSWSLSINGKSSPLGGLKLPPVPVELVLTGDGASVHAEVRVTSKGMFWSWADLVRLEDLSLTLAATTVAR
jgi:hypothetical protein